MFDFELERAAQIQWQADKEERGFAGIFSEAHQAEREDALMEYPELRDMDDSLNGYGLHGYNFYE